VDANATAVAVHRNEGISDPIVSFVAKGICINWISRLYTRTVGKMKLCFRPEV
jgi:hypothetical protein